MKNHQPISLIIIAVLLPGAFLNCNTQSNKVPGTIVDYVPASTGTYPSSPSICILTNGDYIASHDFFGPGSTEYSQGLTAVFRSSDKGKLWEKISEINGQFWSNLFMYNDVLYIMGTFKHNGNFIIRRSLDGGISWSNPTDGKSGLLLAGEYHTAPMPMVIHNGRIWRAIEHPIVYNAKMDPHICPMMISAPVNSDLLCAANWTATNYLLYDSTYLAGKFVNWLEGNAVVSPEGNMLNILRVATSEPGRELAAVVNISEDGMTASFDPLTGFMDFIGGAVKFSIRFDTKSGLYWTICNMLGNKYSDMDAASVRNTLILKSSPDLKNWSVHHLILCHPDVKKHGFQYVDWQFDGQDIIFLSRTAYDDNYGGAHSYHDANYITFHRIINFRCTVK